MKVMSWKNGIKYTFSFLISLIFAFGSDKNYIISCRGLALKQILEWNDNVAAEFYQSKLCRNSKALNNLEKSLFFRGQLTLHVFRTFPRCYVVFTWSCTNVLFHIYSIFHFCGLIVYAFPFVRDTSWRFRLNFYFHTSLWCLKRFYEGFKGFHKTFGGTTKKCGKKLT